MTPKTTQGKEKPTGTRAASAQRGSRSGGVVQAMEDNRAQSTQLPPGEVAQLEDNRTPLVSQLRAAGSAAAADNPPSKNENASGLPGGLKAGVEKLSGMSMSDVKVHQNSAAPKAIQAHAYAQGTDIHLGPGQEKHLPHEAWHVVQQKQGRVQPTKQMKTDVPVNDDRGLEQEADQMGARAMALGASLQAPDAPPEKNGRTGRGIVQGVFGDEAQGGGEQGGVSGKTGASVSINQELILLQGELTMGAKLKGLFGKESTFSQLIKLVEQYSKAASPKAKETYKPQIISTGKKWLDIHKDATSDNDLRKKNSILRIVGALEAEKTQVELATMDDKVSVGAKVNEFFGSPSSFQLVQTAFDEYQKVAHGSVTSMAEFYEIFVKALETRKRIDAWSAKHGDSKDPADQEKMRILSMMNSNLGKLDASLTVQNYFSATATGISMSGLASEKFLVNEVTVNVATPYGLATGSMKDVGVTRNAFTFSELKLELDGEIQVMEGLKIASPSMVLSTSGDSYAVRVGGNVTLEKPEGSIVSNLTASGTVSAGYDFAKRELLQPTLDDGNLTVTLFDKLDLNVQKLEYRDGMLKASSGALTIRAMEKVVTTTVTDLQYSKAEGFSFSDLTLESGSTFEPVPGFSIKESKLKLSKTADGWNLTGSGNLGIEYGNSNFRFDVVNAGVLLTYGFKEGAVKQFEVANGSLDMTIFNTLRLEIANFAYANGALSAASGRLAINVLGQEITGSATDMSYSKEKGFGLGSATLGASGTMEPVPGFAITNPTLSLIQTEGGWQVAGEGQLEFKTSLGEVVKLNRAAGNARLLYSVKDRKIESASVDEGEIDLSLFNLVHVVGSGISFDSAAGLLTIGSAKVDVGVPADAFQAPLLNGSATNLRISKSTFDWDSISMGMPGQISMGGFTFLPPTGILAKDGNSFILSVKDAKGAFQVGSYLQVDGKGSIEWAPHKNNGMPRITDGALSATTGEIDVLQTFVPFFAQNGLDFSTGFTVPFAAGPVPMEAGFTIGGRASAKANINVGMAFNNDTFTATGKVSLKPELGMYIKLSVGVGSRFIAYVGAYVKGALNAALDGHVGFEAEASQQTSGKYAMDKFDMTYGLGANLTANLSVGGEVKALYFFEKELYEISIRSWELGKSEMSGRFDMLGGLNKEDTRSKVFGQLGATGISAAALGIPDPPNQIQHKKYRQEIDKLSAAIDDTQLGADDVANAAGQEAIAKHKARMTQNFNRMISQFEAKQNQLGTKSRDNTTWLENYKVSHVNWLVSQEQKKKEATASRLGIRGLGVGGSGAGLLNFVHFQSKEWYEKKIVQGKAKYETALQDKTTKLQKINEELQVLDTELEVARAILARMESLFSPDGAAQLTAIIEEVYNRRLKIKQAGEKGMAAEGVTPEIFDFPDSEVQ